MAQQPPQRPKGQAGSLQNVEQTETVHHEKRGKRPKKMAELNLTSMLDVCFQLLIFFVLTASFAVGEGILPADLPSGQSAQKSEDEPPDQPIKILLKSLGGESVSIQLEGIPSPPGDFKELYQMMRSMQLTASNPSGIYKPDDPVIIKPDKTVPWAKVVAAFNTAVKAKYSNVNFAQPGG